MGAFVFVRQFLFWFRGSRKNKYLQRRANSFNANNALKNRKLSARVIIFAH
jgi:hypothetical protein